MKYWKIIGIAVLLFLIPLRSIRVFNTFRRAKRAGIITTHFVRGGKASWLLCGIVWILIGVGDLYLYRDPDTAMAVLHMLLGLGFEITAIADLVFFTKKGVYFYNSRKAESFRTEMTDSEIRFYRKDVPEKKKPVKPFCIVDNVDYNRKLFAGFMKDSNVLETSDF